MRKSKFSPEFKNNAIQLIKNSDKSFKELAVTIGASDKTIRTWLRQSEIDAGNGLNNELTTDEKKEFSRLKRENKELRRECDFLKQAAAYFAKVSK